MNCAEGRTSELEDTAGAWDGHAVGSRGRPTLPHGSAGKERVSEPKKLAGHGTDIQLDLKMEHGKSVTCGAAGEEIIVFLFGGGENVTCLRDVQFEDTVWTVEGRTSGSKYTAGAWDGHAVGPRGRVTLRLRLANCARSLRNESRVLLIPGMSVGDCPEHPLFQLLSDAEQMMVAAAGEHTLRDRSRC